MPIDRRERDASLPEALRVAQEGMQAGLWTAMPGIIQSADFGKRTVVVQPAIKALVSKRDGTQEWVALPLLVDCPLVFPGGGGVTLTFPVKKGDECLVVFSSRCIDSWWQSGGLQVQAEMRMHDLSDGFVIPGPRSVPNVEPDISATRATMRSLDGNTSVYLDPAAKSAGMVTTGAAVVVNPDRVDINGVLYINNERYVDHLHTNVQSGGSNTGPKA